MSTAADNLLEELSDLKLQPPTPDRQARIEYLQTLLNYIRPTVVRQRDGNPDEASAHQTTVLPR